MNALTTTSFKLTTLALSAGFVWAAMGGLVDGFQHQALAQNMVHLPTVIVIGHRDPVEAPLTLQARAKPMVKTVAKSGA